MAASNPVSAAVTSPNLLFLPGRLEDADAFHVPAVAAVRVRARLVDGEGQPVRGWLLDGDGVPTGNNGPEFPQFFLTLLNHGF